MYYVMFVHMSDLLYNLSCANIIIVDLEAKPKFIHR